jgi:DNA processing protein
MAVEHWLRLALASGLGPVTLRRLLDAAGSPQAACEAGMPLLRSIEGIGPSKAQQIHAGLAEAALLADEQRQLAEAGGAEIVPFDDERYPALLRTIHDPPPVLFVRGTLEPRDLNAIAIVGSRGCSFYGREQAQRFGSSLAAAGFTVISGGARGVDSAAHRGALVDPAGRTIAVLGCGVDQVYPPENEDLFAQIMRQGALISEFPMGTQPLAEHFPRRNRIVSGMSRGVLVVEADIRSGALITAREACEQNRCVFAIPGKIDNRMSAGPHKLIREGATLVSNMQELIEGLSPLPAEVDEPMLFPDVALDDADDTARRKAAAPREIENKPPAAASKPKAPVTAQQRVLLEALEDDATAVDTLIERTGFEAHVVLQELTLLSLKGLIQRVDGQSYCRKD